MQSESLEQFFYEAFRVLALGALPLLVLAIVGPLVTVLLSKIGVKEGALVYALKLAVVVAIIAGFGQAFISELMMLTKEALE